MDDKDLLTIAKALRWQYDKILALQATFEALQDFVASTTKSDRLEMLITLAEAEQKIRGQQPWREELERFDAMIQLLEHGRNPLQEDS